MTALASSQQMIREHLMAEIVVRWLYEKRRWMPGGSVLATG
jgi:hypothetical protein